MVMADNDDGDNDSALSWSVCENVQTSSWYL
jgi:hypothetical protein